MGHKRKLKEVQADRSLEGALASLRLTSAEMRSPGLHSNQAALVDYVGTFCVSFSELAKQNDLPFLAYLLDMTALECRQFEVVASAGKDANIVGSAR